jgi:cytosine/adenosine deaminase-related metal-dependent hydrolase
MGGEVYLGPAIYGQSWKIGRELDLQIAAHILSPWAIRPILDQLARGKGGRDNDIGIGPDNLFIHMTGISDLGWQAVHDAGAQVSLSVPIEMNMRHGMPPILKLQSLGMEPSLSVDVECTLTADFFTQMRSCMNLQRVLVNQMILDQGPPNPVDWGLPAEAAANPWPTPAAGTLAPLTTRDVLRFATMNGAKALRLDGKTGSLTPGKEADIIILDATRINVAPFNQVPGAVVSLMDRTNVETVVVAEASRDYLFTAANIPLDLFSSQ